MWRRDPESECWVLPHLPPALNVLFEQLVQVFPDYRQAPVGARGFSPGSLDPTLYHTDISSTSWRRRARGCRRGGR